VPKRIVDGEALWTSTKVRRLPLKYRLHYANWIPLAAANGVFEVDFDAIRGRVYAASLRPPFTSKNVYEVACEFVTVGLLQIWQTDDGKVWAYFIGIHKSGRLPGTAVLSRYPSLPPGHPKDVLPVETMLEILKSLFSRSSAYSVSSQ
jgi:hypothetical protein